MSEFSEKKIICNIIFKFFNNVGVNRIKELSYSIIRS